ncbi:ATP-dependent protease [Pseudomonas phage UNO-G1W1]|jgi:ATP-dependent protease ClpP protease subunit|uniref:ATP-dependent protease n=1 Tax=Pseudomonas phage UNO-G1W1 TaxID=3136609 RepID=A0AAX4MX91_9CAUD
MSEEIMGKPNRILVNQHVANEYHVRLARPITEVDDFEDEFQMFACAGERDLIKLDIVTPGGSMDTAHMLCRAIHRTAAHTIAYIGPTCASAGTAIALACEEWEIDDMSSFMIHTGSYGYAGMAPHVKANVDHIDKMMERFVRLTYTGFLTTEEIERVLDGREMYFEGEELAQRLMAYSQYREAMREAIEHDEGVDSDPFDS